MFGRMGIKLQMQTQTGHKQIRTGICADTNRDTYRYGLGYVQIRTGIRADMNRDTCRYEKDMSRYGYTSRSTPH